MTNQEIEKLQEGLRSAHQAVLESLRGVSEAEAREVPEPGEWTVAQLMAHIAEIQSFWMGKAVLITQVEDPNITRSDVENDLRRAAVADHSQDSLTELNQALADANAAAIAATGSIDSKDLTRPGHRGEGNPMNVAGVISYLIGHVEEHARQITLSRSIIQAKNQAAG
ncbi:MAG: DinB family protein [Dehalococcoidia bacterium]